MSVASARMSERDWQRMVLDLAGLYGWRVYHTFDSRRSQPGFPDLVLVRNFELLFCELKTDQGYITREQRDWLDALGRVGAGVRRCVDEADIAEPLRQWSGWPAVEVHVWRPGDFEQVHARLAGRARGTNEKEGESSDREHD